MVSGVKGRRNRVREGEREKEGEGREWREGGYGEVRGCGGGRNTAVSKIQKVKSIIVYRCM